MKKIVLAISFCLAVVVSLQNCTPEKTLPPVDPNDPDSSYIGTPYSFSTLNPPLFRFPTISDPYKDSLTLEGIELGRRLFYDKRLSSTNLLSCASCHKQEFAFADGGNSKSNSVFGPTKRNAPSIENLLWSNKLFWDGRSSTLAGVAKDAFHGEQNLDVPNAIGYLQSDSNYTRLFRKAFGKPGEITEPKIYLALQQFMMTLISSNSRFDKIQRNEAGFQFTESEARGFVIFQTEAGECFHCHTFGNTFLMTDNIFRNNGLDPVTSTNDFTDKGRGLITGNSNEYGMFKDPSLRNIALTAPYMHDGGFQTLEEVIGFYSDTIKPLSPNIDPLMKKVPHTDGRLNLTDEQKQDLLNLLHTFTDTTFIYNPAFSNPF